MFCVAFVLLESHPTLVEKMKVSIVIIRMDSIMHFQSIDMVPLDFGYYKKIQHRHV